MIDRFKKFLSQHSYKEISRFLESEKERFYKSHSKKSENERRQGWVSYVGHNLEKLFEVLLEDFCQKNNIGLTKDKYLKRQNLSQELAQVKRLISVDFGDYLLLPDADIVLYKRDPLKVLAILSIKNSFRERYTETPYWKLKLSSDEITKDIQVFMVTPDKDNEISFYSSSRGPRKARIVMEYELDGIYLAKEEFDPSPKVKSIEFLIRDLEKLL